jgi:peptide-methionine (S)-S-oxide reductase
MESETQKAAFAAGCFWGVEYVFSKLPGVLAIQVGYMGGDERRYPHPTYKQVCSDRTGYAETIEIIFNPKIISYAKLLKVFWNIHDPTTPNRQGPDFGTQYRSVIFYFNEQQKNQAQSSKTRFQKKLGTKKIVTEIVRAGKFFPAEEYHQKYVEKNGVFSCHIPTLPKNILK